MMKTSLKWMVQRNPTDIGPEFSKLPSPSKEKLLELARAARREEIKNVKIFTVEDGLETVY